MTTSAMYIGLHTITMNPCDMTDDAYEFARATWLCLGCCRPKPTLQAIDAHLVSPPKGKPLNVVNGCGLSVAYKPFLDRIPEDAVQRDLYLGRVFAADGKEIPDWVTFRGRLRVIIRGDKHAGHRRCADCGRDVYFAMGRPYLFPMPPAGASLLESDLGLVIAREIYVAASIKKQPLLRIDELPVLDKPRDGFGVFENP